MSLEETIKKGKLSFISQINLNSFKTPSEIIKYSSAISPYVDAIILNEQISSDIGMCSIAASHLMKDLGPEPIINFSANNQEKDEMLSFFRTSWFLGIKNLCVSENNIHLFKTSEDKDKHIKNRYSRDDIHSLLNTLSSDKISDKIKFNIFSILDFENNSIDELLKQIEEEEKNDVKSFITSPIYNKQIINDMISVVRTKKINIYPTIDPSKNTKDLKNLYKKNEKLVSKKLINDISKNHTEDKMLKFLGGMIKSLKNSAAGFNLLGNRQQFVKLFKYSALKSRLKKSLGGTNIHMQKFNRIADAKLTLKEFEKAYIIRILKTTGGNRSEAAKILGIHRNTLMRKCDEFKIEV